MGTVGSKSVNILPQSSRMNPALWCRGEMLPAAMMFCLLAVSALPLEEEAGLEEVELVVGVDEAKIVEKRNSPTPARIAGSLVENVKQVLARFLDLALIYSADQPIPEPACGLQQRVRPADLPADRLQGGRGPRPSRFRARLLAQDGLHRLPGRVRGGGWALLP